jgi:hypothetical protein
VGEQGPVVLCFGCPSPASDPASCCCTPSGTGAVWRGCVRLRLVWTAHLFQPNARNSVGRARRNWVAVSALRVCRALRSRRFFCRWSGPGGSAAGRAGFVGRCDAVLLTLRIACRGDLGLVRGA